MNGTDESAADETDSVTKCIPAAMPLVSKYFPSAQKAPLRPPKRSGLGIEIPGIQHHRLSVVQHKRTRVRVNILRMLFLYETTRAFESYFFSDIARVQTHTISDDSAKTKRVALDADSSTLISADAHVNSVNGVAEAVEPSASEPESLNARNSVL